jgi:hypothetical protein
VWFSRGDALDFDAVFPSVTKVVKVMEGTVMISVCRRA